MKKEFEELNILKSSIINNTNDIFFSVINNNVAGSDGSKLTIYFGSKYGFVNDKFLTIVGGNKND